MRFFGPEKLLNNWVSNDKRSRSHLQLFAYENFPENTKSLSLKPNS